MRYSTYLCIVAGGLLLAAAAQATSPKTMRFGVVQEFRLQDEVELEWSVNSYGPKPTLQNGEKFAVVTVTARQGKSIGKYDYTLSGGRCLAMAVGEAPFKPDAWEHIQGNVPADTRLLYVVREAEAPFFLELTYKVPSVAERGIVLGVKEAEPEADPDAAGEQPVDPGAVDAGDEAIAAPAEPAPAAPEPEVKPEPETKPEEKPEEKPEAKPEPKPQPRQEPQIIW